MKFVADTHAHTLASGHAYSTIREMAAAGAAKGNNRTCTRDAGHLQFHLFSESGCCPEGNEWDADALWS